MELFALLQTDGQQRIVKAHERCIRALMHNIRLDDGDDGEQIRNKAADWAAELAVECYRAPDVNALCRVIMEHNRRTADVSERYALRFFSTYLELDLTIKQSKTPTKRTAELTDRFHLMRAKDMACVYPRSQMALVNHVAIIFVIWLPGDQYVEAMSRVYDPEAFVVPPVLSELDRKLSRAIGHTVWIPADRVNPEGICQLIANVKDCSMIEAEAILFKLVRLCAGCLRYGVTFSKCSGCLHVHYCSVECQRQDWKLKHKSDCRIEEGK